MEQQQSTPWWREGMVWMVIAGPALVVVAGFVTLWLALNIDDPVIAHDPSHLDQGAQVDKRLMPAENGRNHAITPTRDVPLKASGG